MRPTKFLEASPHEVLACRDDNSVLANELKDSWCHTRKMKMDDVGFFGSLDALVWDIFWELSEDGDELMTAVFEAILLFGKICGTCTLIGTDATVADSPATATGSVLRCFGKDLRKIALWLRGPLRLAHFRLIRFSALPVDAGCSRNLPGEAALSDVSVRSHLDWLNNECPSQFF